MGRIIEIPFSRNIIEFVAEKLLEEEKSNFSSVTVVFPHKRPILYLRQILSSRIGHPFFSPRMLSMDEFISTLAMEKAPGIRKIDNLESAYLLFQIVSEIPESPWRKSATSFSEFLFWGLKIGEVIDELDIELVEDSRLTGTGESWGEAVSKKTQFLLGHLREIRQKFHIVLERERLTTRAQEYARAAENTAVQFPAIYFVGIFSMTEAEKRVIRHFLSKSQRAYLIRQNDGSKWKSFEEMDRWAEKEVIREISSPEISLHSAFNVHSEVVGLREILTSAPLQDCERIAIVLPEPETLIPLLSGVMTSLNTDYNITMGYPAMRTPLYTLLEIITRLEETRIGDSYSARDYLSLLMHPLVKNFGYVIEPVYMRILAHSVEEFLLKGKPFIKLDEIEQKNEIFERAARLAERKISLQEFREGIKNVHEIFVRKIKEVKTFHHLGKVLEEILTFLLRHSPVAHYPFSVEFFHTFFLLSDRLRNSLLRDEEFRSSGELFELFRYLARETKIPFHGIPLKGLQILGPLEARCLSFREVFLLDSNEGILSSAAPEDSLLPFSLRVELGLPIHYQKEELYRYHFHSLIFSSRKAHIFYRETEKELRSHLIEKLVWEKEKSVRKIGFIKPERVALTVLPGSSPSFEVPKTSEVLGALQEISFSPTALNSYLLCPASFYFAHVLRLKERKEMEPDTTLIGIILHKVMEKLYRPFVGITLKETDYFRHLKENLPRVLDTVFFETFGEVYGEHYLLKELVLIRLKDILLRKFPGNTISVEEHLSSSLKLKNGITVYLSGHTDRIDYDGKEYTIVDYKSGRNLKWHSFEVSELSFSGRTQLKRKIKSLQLPLYVFLYHRVHHIAYEDINSKLLSLRTGEEQMLFSTSTNREKFMEETFLPLLKSLLQEIFDPEIPFIRDDTDEKVCEYCPFPTFCHKNP